MFQNIGMSVSALALDERLGISGIWNQTVVKLPYAVIMQIYRT
jgi:hypothetical protein